MGKLRRPEAAALIGISPRTLEKLAVTGGGPSYYKIGATVLYDIADLEAWLEKHKRTSTSDQGRNV
jgi:predicted DNA-binding transcriptional regulator AlpA